MEKTCPICGKQFKATSGQKYCSTSCRNDAIAGYRIDKSKVIELLEQKKTIKSIAKELGYRYERLLYFIKKNGIRWKDYQWKRTCVVCGRTFISQNPRKICSRECQSEFLKTLYKVDVKFLEKSKNADPTHHNKILKVVDDLTSKGYRCVPVHWRRPNIVAFKDGKVYLVEVYTRRKPNLERFNHLKPFVDEIIAIKLS